MPLTDDKYKTYQNYYFNAVRQTELCKELLHMQQVPCAWQK